MVGGHLDLILWSDLVIVCGTETVGEQVTEFWQLDVVHFVYVVLLDFDLFTGVEFGLETVLVTGWGFWRVGTGCWTDAACARVAGCHRPTAWVLAAHWTVIQTWAFGHLWLSETFWDFLLGFICFEKLLGRILGLLTVKSWCQSLILLLYWLFFVFSDIGFWTKMIFHPVLSLFLIERYPSDTCQLEIIATVSHRYLVTSEIRIVIVQIRIPTWPVLTGLSFWPFYSQKLLIQSLLCDVLWQ